MIAIFGRNQPRTAALSRDDMNLPRLAEGRAHKRNFFAVRGPVRLVGYRGSKRKLEPLRSICPASPKYTFGECHISDPFPIWRETDGVSRDTGQEWKKLPSFFVVAHQLAPRLLYDDE